MQYTVECSGSQETKGIERLQGDDCAGFEGHIVLISDSHLTRGWRGDCPGGGWIWTHWITSKCIPLKRTIWRIYEFRISRGQVWKKEVEERLVLYSLSASSVHLTYLGVSQRPVEQFTQTSYMVPLIYSQSTGIRQFSMVRESRSERTLEIWSTCEVHLARSPPCLACPSYFLWGIVSLTCSFSLKQLGRALVKLARSLRWNASIPFLQFPLTFWCPFPIPHSSSHQVSSWDLLNDK